MALLVGGVFFIGYLFFSRFTEKNARALDAIPEDAAFIIEIRHLPEVWDKLTHTNLMWPDLKKKEPFSIIDKIGKELEKSGKKNLELAKYLSENKVIISLHLAGGGLNFLFACENISSDEKALSFIKDVSGNEAKAARSYDDIQLYQFNAGSQRLVAGYLSGVLVFSNSESLTEVALKRIRDENKFDENKSFQKLNHTVSKNVDANIYIHHRHFPLALTLLGKEEMKETLHSLSGYADMSELDMLIGPNNVALSGFSIADEKKNHFLSVFKSQEPQSFNITRFVPDKIKQMVFVGLSDVELFYEDRLKLLKGEKKLKNHQEELNSFNREHDCNLKQHILSWIGNEMVIFDIAYDSLNASNKFLIIKKNETGNASEELKKLSQKLDTSSREILINGGVELRHLNANGMFSILLGDIFQGIDQPYYIEGEEYIIFSTSSSALQKYLSDLAYDKVLARSAGFVSYVSENLSEKANLFYYAQVGKMQEVLQPLLNDKLKAQMIQNSELFQHFDAFSWQISRSENMFYNRLFVRYNPNTKIEENTFWELALDTTVSRKPQLIKNHITQTKDIFVQDDDYTIYLIDNKGKLSWKKPMTEKIVGEIAQVDMLNNGKLQMAFCTESQLHIIDIKGNYLKGYPVNLPKTVTGQFAVFDYESDKNYRFMIPSNNKLMNLDKEGKVVTGWQFDGAKSNISQAPEFHRINGKDYIFTIDEKGNLFMLDRKGKERYNINTALKFRSKNKVYFEAGKEIENCNIIYSDSSGKINRLYFNGRVDSVTIRPLTSNHYFTLIDANNDGKKDIVLHEEDKITIHTWSKEKLVEHIFDRIITEEPMVFKGSDRNIWMGALNKVDQLIYLIDNSGLLHERFPAPGTTLFMMEDMNNDGNLDIVVGAPLGKIFSYTIK